MMALDSGYWETNEPKYGEWISVEDELPDLIPCNAGTAYSEAVIIWTTRLSRNLVLTTSPLNRLMLLPQKKKLMRKKSIGSSSIMPLNRGIMFHPVAETVGIIAK